MTKQGTWMSLVLAIGLGLGGMVWTPGGNAAATTAVRETSPVSAGPRERASAGVAEVQDYARREAASSRDLEKFSGGDDVVYISGGAILLAIIIILILL